MDKSTQQVANELYENMHSQKVIASKDTKKNPFLILAGINVFLFIELLLWTGDNNHYEQLHNPGAIQSTSFSGIMSLVFLISWLLEAGFMLGYYYNQHHSIRKET